MVVDGCPAGLAISAEIIQRDLDRRKPGQSRYTTQRREADEVKILSGVFEDERTDGLRTTGTPISLLIENTDQRSKDYSDIRDKFRPGHADYTYFQKYGIRDYRGGGRSSARETAARVAGAVAAGDPASQNPGLTRCRPGRIKHYGNFDWERSTEPFFVPCTGCGKWAVISMHPQIRPSVGAVVEEWWRKASAGWGADSGKFAGYRFGIDQRRQGRKIGEGWRMERPARRRPDARENLPEFLSNRAGIWADFQWRRSLALLRSSPRADPHAAPDRDDANGTPTLSPRPPYPCVGIAVPIGEAMMACVLAGTSCAIVSGRDDGGIGFEG